MLKKNIDKGSYFLEIYISSMVVEVTRDNLKHDLKEHEDLHPATTTNTTATITNSTTTTNGTFKIQPPQLLYLMATPPVKQSHHPPWLGL